MLLVAGAALLITGFASRHDALAAGILSVVAGVFVLLAFSFWRLTVADAGDHLSVQYGPLPIFGTRVAFASMTDVAADRSALIDGWGIHFVPGRGWTYNLWGRDCVRIHTVDSTLRIGTDDQTNLERFLRTRIAAVRSNAYVET